MSHDNKTQFQNFNYGGVGALHDPSWLDKYAPKRPHEVNSAGFQVQRYAKWESYDADEDGTRQPVVKLDDESDPMISIIEPLNFIYHVHEYNSKHDPLTNPEINEDLGTQDVGAVDFNAYLKQIEDTEATEGGEGRRRPHSKVFAFGTINDDKHLIGSRLSRSTAETRYSDYRTGRRHQIDLVRETLTPEGELSTTEISEIADEMIKDASGGTAAIPDEGYTRPKTAEPRTDATAFDPEFWPSDRLMTIINNGFEQSGGYVFQSSALYSNSVIHVDDAEKPPGGNYAQWGDLFVLTEDDIYAYTQRDNIGRTLMNIWTKGHFHRDAAHDGPIDMVEPFAPEKTVGFLVSGDLRILKSRANAAPSWGMESGKWVPVVGIPRLYEVPTADPTGYTDSHTSMYVTPEQFTVGHAQVAGFQPDVMEMIHGQAFFNPQPTLEVDNIPTQLRLMFITPIPAGEIVIHSDAVFRYRLEVLRHGGVSDLPDYVRCGDIVVPIDTVNNDVQSLLHDSFHLHDFQAGDEIILELTRDWNDPRDTAGFNVYFKGMRLVTGQYCEAGTFFGTTFGDYTAVSDGETVQNSNSIFS